jgi:hypothetical protein
MPLSIWENVDCEKRGGGRKAEGGGRKAEEGKRKAEKGLRIRDFRSQISDFQLPIHWPLPTDPCPLISSPSAFRFPLSLDPHARLHGVADDDAGVAGDLVGEDAGVGDNGLELAAHVFDVLGRTVEPVV